MGGDVVGGAGPDPWERIEARRRERAHLDRFLAIGNWLEFGVFCLAVLASVFSSGGQVGFVVLAMVCAVSALFGHGLRRYVAAVSDGAWDSFYATVARLLPVKRFR